MIYYFSGTGNTRTVAQGLASRLNDEASTIGNDKIQPCDLLGLVFPVYSWGVAPIIVEWLNTVKFPTKKPSYVWTILTYGDEAGYAHQMLRQTLENRGIILHAVFGVQMPNTYVLLPGFDVDKKSISDEKLSNISTRLDAISSHITDRGEGIEDLVIGSFPFIKSRLIYPLFKKFGIFPSQWHYDSAACISCSICAKSCPVKNITMQKGHPCWGENCTSCLGCYHSCPRHAVQYGNLTRHKGQWRYWFC